MPFSDATFVGTVLDGVGRDKADYIGEHEKVNQYSQKIAQKLPNKYRSVKKYSHRMRRVNRPIDRPKEQSDLRDSDRSAVMIMNF